MNIFYIQELLKQAKKICIQRNVRLTSHRFEVLRLLILQQNAISAYDLLDLLRKRKPQAKPPTIYRALDFLLEQGFAHKVESINSYMLCHLFDRPRHTSILFICNQCCTVKEKKVEEIENIIYDSATRYNFVLFHIMIEVHGLCSICNKWKVN